MKKLVSVILALAMLLSMAAIAETTDYIGVWYLNKLAMEGMELSASSMGMEMTMEIKEDGTASLNGVVEGEEQVEEGTWTLEGETLTVTLDESGMDFTLVEGNLVAESDGLSMIFGREKVEEEPFVPAEPKADAAEADYAGAWVSFAMDMGGMYMDPALFGMGLNASVEGTTLTVDGFLFSNETYELTFADGALSFKAEDPESVMIAGITLQLLEDDTMSITMTSSDDLVLIMKRAEEGAVEEAA